MDFNYFILFHFMSVTNSLDLSGLQIIVARYREHGENPGAFIFTLNMCKNRREKVVCPGSPHEVSRMVLKE